MDTIKLRKGERATLDRLMRSRSGSAAVARRARLIVLSVDGIAFNEIRARLDCDVRFIRRWRERFIAGRVVALSTLPKEPSKAKTEARLEARVLDYAVTRKTISSRCTARASKKCSASRRPQSFDEFSAGSEYRP
ncbi:helix-turn-helix domain-containing protein [Hydrocarboniphaga sp.]|uniref:helix-turn-helix domain-containing protein n=1 Tax=Hydrocarboniphaga sp. TaxID=2033016 RepID=UPI002602A797|nr:helix-turn-helix domain-containing protein [Hydrocarboniphaga sp.]